LGTAEANSIHASYALQAGYEQLICSIGLVRPPLSLHRHKRYDMFSLFFCIGLTPGSCWRKGARRH
jgi:hypothetical protein